MQLIEKKVLVAHTPAQMFALVDDVLNYPKFLPWCSKTEVHNRNDVDVEATLYIDYLKVKQHFTTKNVNQAPESIQMVLVDGPFKYLSGSWSFKALGDFGCKVEFTLAYEFSSVLLEKIIGPVFGHISSTLVDAFIAHADKVYADE